jgi:hypothetical protein
LELISQLAIFQIYKNLYEEQTKPNKKDMGYEGRVHQRTNENGS